MCLLAVQSCARLPSTPAPAPPAVSSATCNTCKCSMALAASSRPQLWLPQAALAHSAAPRQGARRCPQCRQRAARAAWCGARQALHPRVRRPRALGAGAGGWSLTLPRYMRSTRVLAASSTAAARALEAASSAAAAAAASASCLAAATASATAAATAFSCGKGRQGGSVRGQIGMMEGSSSRQQRVQTRSLRFSPCLWLLEALWHTGLPAAPLPAMGTRRSCPHEV